MVVATLSHDGQNLTVEINTLHYAGSGTVAYDGAHKRCCGGYNAVVDAVGHTVIVIACAIVRIHTGDATAYSVGIYRSGVDTVVDKHTCGESGDAAAIHRRAGGPAARYRLHGDVSHIDALVDATRVIGHDACAVCTVGGNGTGVETFLHQTGVVGDDAGGVSAEYAYGGVVAAILYAAGVSNGYTGAISTALKQTGGIYGKILDNAQTADNAEGCFEALLLGGVERGIGPRTIFIIVYYCPLKIF